MSNSFHKSLADKFNKKKTINNDLSRISNIHKKTNTSVPILKNSLLIKNNSFEQPVTADYSVLDFDKIQTSTTLNLTISRENNNDKLPKIVFKEVIVPNNSKELIEINKITTHNSHLNNMTLQSTEININEIDNYFNKISANNTLINDSTTENTTKSKKNISDPFFEINNKNIRK